MSKIDVFHRHFGMERSPDPWNYNFNGDKLVRVYEIKLLSKGVSIFISASAISAYRHLFFLISTYQLSAKIFSAHDFSHMQISAISAHRQSLIRAYRQKCDIRTPLLLGYFNSVEHSRLLKHYIKMS